MPDLGFGLGALGIGVVLGLTIALIAGWIGGKRPSRVAGAATPGRAIHRAQNRLDRDRLRAERKVTGERGYSQAAAVVGSTSTTQRCPRACRNRHHPRSGGSGARSWALIGQHQGQLAVLGRLVVEPGGANL